MKYLVTGGAGFIGSNFIHYILNKYSDAEIINLDKLTYAGNLDNLKKWEDSERHRFVHGDICDSAVVEPLVKECDVIVNFAAESHVDRSILGPAEFVKTNVLGTQVLLDAANKYEKWFHHISTDEVFGSLPMDRPDLKFDETTAYDPKSPYSASKGSSDHLVRAYINTFGLPATISNCSNNYGPYQHVEKFIPLMTINALTGKPLPVYGDGLNMRDWIHVDDHCNAIDLILQKGQVGETYLVGGNCEVSNIDVVKSILKLLNKSEELIKHVPDRPGHDRRYAIDSSRIERELGYTRKYDFASGLKQTVEWYQANEVWWRNVLSGDFKNYYQKQYGLR